MKKQILVLASFAVFCFLFVACGSGNGEEQTPELKKSILEQRLASKRTEIDKLQFELKELEKELKMLDPSYFEKEEEKKWRLVSVKSVEKKDFEQFNEFTGTVTTRDNFMASPEIGGVVTSMTLKEGDYVRKGQLIATTDDSAMKSSLAEIETGLSLARDVFQRRQKLWNQNIGSELEFLQAKNQVESLEKSMATLKTQMSKTSVYAPYSGVVERVMVKQGEMAGPGSPILSIINTANVQVVADLPENYLASTSVGDPVNVRIDALDMEQTGKIRKLSQTIHPTNRTFEIEIGVSNKSGKIKPNLMASVSMKEFSKKDALVIPTNIVQKDPKGNYIYVVSEASGKVVAKRLEIETGPSANGETVVLNGMKGDETVIIDGFQMVNDGDPIKVMDK